MRPISSAHFRAETKKILGIQSGHRAAPYPTQLIGYRSFVPSSIFSFSSTAISPNFLSLSMRLCMASFDLILRNSQRSLLFPRAGLFEQLMSATKSCRPRTLQRTWTRLYQCSSLLFLSRFSCAYSSRFRASSHATCLPYASQDVGEGKRSSEEPEDGEPRKTLPLMKIA